MTIWSRRESTATRERLVIGALCLTAGLSYLAILRLLPFPAEAYFLFGLSSFFFTSTLLMKRSRSLGRYWQLPFAFFIFALSGALDIIITQGFIVNVIHETSTATNPLASTVLGTVLAQLVSTLSIVIPIVLLTKFSGASLSSIFIERGRSWKGLRTGVVGFLLFYFLTFSGLFHTLFPDNGVTWPRFLALTPAIMILVLSNGLREELWFRGLFLKKYARFLGSMPSNLVQAIIFTSFHLQVRYTPYLSVFVGITFILGLWLGYMMKESESLLGPAVFHAGADIPIYLAFLSSASP